MRIEIGHTSTKEQFNCIRMKGESGAYWDINYRTVEDLIEVLNNGIKQTDDKLKVWIVGKVKMPINKPKE